MGHPSSSSSSSSICLSSTHLNSHPFIFQPSEQPSIHLPAILLIYIHPSSIPNSFLFFFSFNALTSIGNIVAYLKSTSLPFIHQCTPVKPATTTHTQRRAQTCQYSAAEFYQLNSPAVSHATNLSFNIFLVLVLKSPVKWSRWREDGSHAT